MFFFWSNFRDDKFGFNSGKRNLDLMLRWSYFGEMFTVFNLHSCCSVRNSSKIFIFIDQFLIFNDVLASKLVEFSQSIQRKSLMFIKRSSRQIFYPSFIAHFNDGFVAFSYVREEKTEKKMHSHPLRLVMVVDSDENSTILIIILL